MQAEALNKTPGTPAVLDEQEYYMHYRHGMNSKLEKYFKHKGDLISARKRAQEHCEVMGYRLIWVRPLFINLEEEENQQKGYKNKDATGS
jgi:hypothetical protein